MLSSGGDFIAASRARRRVIADFEALAEPRRASSPMFRIRKTHFIFEQGKPMTKSVLIAAALALALVGCSDSNKAAADKAAADAKAATEKAAQATKDAADKAAQATKEAAEKAKDAMSSPSSSSAPAPGAAPAAAPEPATPPADSTKK
jgi:membrane protein involved in colicin uptake